MAQLNVKNLTFQYPEHIEKVVEDVSFKINAGDFAVICGPSGCGKTTLLRLLKKELQPVGKLTGDIHFEGKSLSDWDEKNLLEQIGMVFQNPDNQIVMDDVLQEIVFGMENLNYSHFEMQKRVAEMISFFGMEKLLTAKPSELSGGQKQMVNLLSVMLLRPKILLLDEPTSQLDPVAAKELLTMLEKLNKEMGMTIILVEHRLEDLFSAADHVLIMDNGTLVNEGNSREIIQKIYTKSLPSFKFFLPSISRLYVERAENVEVSDIPLTVKETRAWLNDDRTAIVTRPEINLKNETQSLNEQIIDLKDIYFKYTKDASFVLKDLNLTIQRGDYFALVGGNGSGKTTLLKACMGLIHPQRGRINLFGDKLTSKQFQHLYQKIAYLPQNPKTYFIQDTIEKEMQQVIQTHKIEDGARRMSELLAYFEITHLRNRHPYDCSGGEMQRAVLACLLLRTPDILFIDEPTKGLDPISKENLAKMFKKLHLAGLTIVMVTHDIEFAAQNALQSAMLFNGSISALGTPERLFKDNYFYTTAINRATRDIKQLNTLTLEEALLKWQKKTARWQ